ncbi:UPF0223 family protein [Salinicoccus albus]|uniref:UPF0223 family protein n=1 Tax=Salinicoccus albus TaxID=418756 RepID=UPI00036C74F1|nr:UPF0223 family protein [Salinicoccus albus]
MPDEYSYPIDADWTTEEIIDVVEFFETIERAYGAGISPEELREKYRRFKAVIPSKSEEKTVFKAFKKSSGFEAYTAVKQLKESEDGRTIKI